MKMNGCIVLCFLLLITVSMSQRPKPSKKISLRQLVDLAEDLNIDTGKMREKRRDTTWEHCKGWNQYKNTEKECDDIGCIYIKTQFAAIAECGKEVPWVDNSLCFPGSAKVTTPTGNVAMETLNIGDRVLTVLDNEKLDYTKVVGFAQRQPDNKGQFMLITTVNQAGNTHTVKLTASHRIYVKSRDVDDYIPRMAGEVFIGDVLKTQTGNGMAEATVTHITLKKEAGVFNPLTETGTMLVDGTLVSCYGSFNHYLAHMAMAPIRWFPWLFTDAEKLLDGRMPYVETLKYIARNYIAPIVSVN